jgi:GNAT superfamily N-acetyltransferase
MEFSIAPLADHLELVPTLAHWHWSEWETEDPQGTPEKWAERLARRTRRDGIPTTFVALSSPLSGGQLLGSASLVEHDLPPRPDLTPWLAGVYVAPAWRGRGVGSALVRRAVAFAAALGIPRLYLHTSTAEHLYAALGWEVLERCQYAGQDMAIMAIVPAAAVAGPST